MGFARACHGDDLALEIFVFDRAEAFEFEIGFGAVVVAVGNHGGWRFWLAICFAVAILFCSGSFFLFDVE